MNELNNALAQYQAAIYEQTWLSFEMVLGAGFISIIAGFLLGLALFNIQRVSRTLSLITLPLRIIVTLMGSYPIVIMAVVLVPFLRIMYGTSLGSEVGQFILMVWGVFFFTSLINSSLSDKEDDDRLPVRIVKNIRLLIVMLISGNAILGVLGLGGLGELVIRLNDQSFNIGLIIIVGLIYLAFIAVIELFFAILVGILRSQLIPIESVNASKQIQSSSHQSSSQNGRAEIPSASKRENSASDLDYLIRKK